MTFVKCDMRNCIYNKDGKCTSNFIWIYGNNFCGSFTTKQKAEKDKKLYEAD